MSDEDTQLRMADQQIFEEQRIAQGETEARMMGLPAGEESVRKIKAVKPAADIVAEMMVEAREILTAELAATSKG